MKDEKIKSIMDVFVCNFNRENEESCIQKGSKILTDQLKRWAKEETNREIKVFRSGCLGRCSEGIALACFPEKKFILEARTDDFEEIKEGLHKALHEIKNSP